MNLLTHILLLYKYSLRHRAQAPMFWSEQRCGCVVLDHQYGRYATSISPVYKVADFPDTLALDQAQAGIQVHISPNEVNVNLDPGPGHFDYSNMSQAYWCQSMLLAEIQFLRFTRGGLELPPL
jgi:hypothetical protein